MSRIYVCPLSKLEQTVRETDAQTVVTLIDHATPVSRPPSVLPSRWLFVAISDISEHLEGHVLAQDAHMAELLAFVEAWDRRAPMVIHCYAGVSRSTAAAFIAACALEPEVPEDAFARRLRLVSPTATPNPRLVALADSRLSRKGRMIAAVRAIGRGEDCFEGSPFCLDLGREARTSARIA